MLAPVDLSRIAQCLTEIGDEIRDAFERATNPPENDPDVPLEALDRLLVTLETSALEPARDGEFGLCARERALTQRLVHGLDLLAELAAIARALQLPTLARRVSTLALPLSCWVLRHGGELLRPAPLVDAAAGLANTTADPDELVALHRLISEILDGIGTERLQDPAGPEAARAWRVLLYNRAIVATRTQQPPLMHEAFEALIELAPELAPGFFREGMEQMETHDYPEPVRALMQAYYSRWAQETRLH
ncbi:MULTISPECIES: hypothetical protein [Marichromatium]|uniref:Uncharacterized protein n=1 Tax=Marichromatium gracile TaxID=1048 RepID=A0A4R4A7N3_MARGR|nr:MULTISPECIES: hypothetical protein [Marichromatium]MBK1709869.1 hypothetical protein [Marichromatium gracile]MBO8087465.1 hypothetical protein [Marichromatium sp.]RNE92879.1 hypothetical protein EBL85_09890 [Marichromatium sp. AB32]TCW34848.1 hypothetical protein EDC29_1088 [Marichromatium gracile]